MNIPIDEQIARQRAVIRHCEGKSGINIDGDKAILASLEKLAAIESQPVPVEPDVLRLRNGFFCEPDGSHSPTYGKYVRKNDYDSLQSALKLAQEERDDAYEVADSESKGVWSETLLRYAKFNGEHLAVCFERNEYRERANKAESLNRRMVELLKEIQGHVDFDDGEGNNDSSILRGRLSMIGDCVKAMSAELLKEVEK